MRQYVLKLLKKNWILDFILPVNVNIIFLPHLVQRNLHFLSSPSQSNSGMLCEIWCCSSRNCSATFPRTSPQVQWTGVKR